MLDKQVLVLGTKIIVKQDLSLSHAGTVWDGALCLIAYLEKNKQISKEILENKVILELGSGTGILGLSTIPFNPKHVYLTDLPEFEIFINNNIDLNKAQDKCVYSRLIWGNKQDMQKIGIVDTIIGSQLAYDAKNVIELMQTISHFKKLNQHLQVIISFQKYKQKWKNLQYKFSELVSKNYRLVQWNQMDETYRDQFIGILHFNAK